MSVRIKFELNYSVSENQAGSKELGQSSPWVGINDQMDDGGTTRWRIGAGAMDTPVGINSLTTCRFLAIKTTQTISFKLNSTGNTPTTIRALGYGAMDGHFIMTTDTVTALYFSNAGSVDAEVTITIAGTI
jgi:hypothetical protein